MCMYMRTKICYSVRTGKCANMRESEKGNAHKFTALGVNYLANRGSQEPSSPKANQKQLRHKIEAHWLASNDLACSQQSREWVLVRILWTLWVNHAHNAACIRWDRASLLFVDTRRTWSDLCVYSCGRDDIRRKSYFEICNKIQFIWSVKTQPGVDVLNERAQGQGEMDREKLRNVEGEFGFSTISKKMIFFSSEESTGAIFEFARKRSPWYLRKVEENFKISHRRSKIFFARTREKFLKDLREFSSLLCESL